MSPQKPVRPPSAATKSVTRIFHGRLAVRRDESRNERNWTAEQLADRAGISRGLVYRALRGEEVSLEATFRLVTALGLKLEWELVDPRLKSPRPRQDAVHSAMGEFEARHLRSHR